MSDQTPSKIYDPVIEAYKKDIDRTLIRENLRLSIEERFNKLMMLQKFAEELDSSQRVYLIDSALAELEAIAEEVEDNQ